MFGFLRRVFQVLRRAKPHPAGEHQRFRTREDGVDEVEVHVAGVCVRRVIDGWEVLVARRQSTRSLYPGQWECGGGQLRKGEGFSTALRRQFFEEFGLDVEPRHPLVDYEIHGSNVGEGVIPGIRFLCEAREGEVRLNAREFSVHRWIKLPVEEPLDWIGGIREALDVVAADLAASGMEFPLRVIASLSDETREDISTCLKRYRDRDFDGAITTICGVVDRLTARLYESHGLGDYRGDTYHQRVAKAVRTLEPNYRAMLRTLDSDKATEFWDNHRRAVTQAGNVLGAFRREFSDSHGVNSADPKLVRSAIDCALFIVQGLSERH